MFDMSVEEEETLLDKLWERTDMLPHDSCTIVEDSDLPCPKCHDGKIETKCVVERHQGEIWSRCYTHRCNSCGTVFELNPLWSDVRLRSPFDEIGSLETPFGTFHALVNGREVPLRHRAVMRDIGGEYGEVPFHEMDVDIFGCSVGDVVQCRFEDAHLESIDGDERVEYRGGVNGEYVIEVIGCNPEIDYYRGTSYGWELERDYPYDLREQTLRGFDYIIERDPKGYDFAAYYWSRFISLGAVWVPKPYESFTLDDEAAIELSDRFEMFL